jgi:hypothetical protein
MGVEPVGEMERERETDLGSEGDLKSHTLGLGLSTGQQQEAAIKQGYASSDSSSKPQESFLN